jgi:glucosamine 6-phosphate synthetase-like amidotransferase/phosphosugar isomerase protein
VTFNAVGVKRKVRYSPASWSAKAAFAGNARGRRNGHSTQNNVHPHATGKPAAVHSSIIEDSAELRREPDASGAKFATESDSQEAAHLVSINELRCFRGQSGLARPAATATTFSLSCRTLNKQR